MDDNDSLAELRMVTESLQAGPLSRGLCSTTRKVPSPDTYYYGIGCCRVPSLESPWSLGSLDRKEKVSQAIQAIQA